MSRLAAVSLFVLGLFAAQGCDSSEDEGKADPDAAACGRGDTRECKGPGACQGAQVCLEDGSGFGSCLCGNDTGGSSAGGKGGSGTGGGDTAGAAAGGSSGSG